MGRNIRERHNYYEEHKDEIVADLQTIGDEATRKKWDIPKGGTLPTLKKRWLTSRQPDEPTPSTNAKLPKFPEFSNTWDPSVQFKWLEVYESLQKAEGGPKCYTEE